MVLEDKAEDRPVRGDTDYSIPNSAPAMMNLIAPEAVFVRLRAGNKKQVLQELSRRAAALLGLDEKRILQVLTEREKLGTTGIGRGIAMPHGKLSELTRTFVLFAKLEKPVPFEAIDEEPVDLMCLLLAPENKDGEHLHILARISRLLRDNRFCAKLRGCHKAETLYALLSEIENAGTV